MPAIRKDSTEISLAELVAQMPDGCRARRELEAMKEIIRVADGLHIMMCRPAHVFSCGVYNSKDFMKMFDGKCTCGVDATSALYTKALAAYKEAAKQPKNPEAVK